MFPFREDIVSFRTVGMPACCGLLCGCVMDAGKTEVDRNACDRDERKDSIAAR